MKSCSNCSQTIQQHYCSNCGQKWTAHKLTEKTILNDIINGLFSVEQSLFSNLWLGLTNPRKLVENYWNGFRNYYFSPGKFLAIACFFLVLNFWINEASFLKIQVVSNQMQLQFVFAIGLLMFTTISSYLTFWFWKRNKEEHLVMNIYNFSIWTIFFTPISIAAKQIAFIRDDIAFFAYLCLILIWNARVFKTSFPKKIGLIILNILLFASLIYSFAKFTEFKKMNLF